MFNYQGENATLSIYINEYNVLYEHFSGKTYIVYPTESEYNLFLQLKIALIELLVYSEQNAPKWKEENKAQIENELAFIADKEKFFVNSKFPTIKLDVDSEVEKKLNKMASYSRLKDGALDKIKDIPVLGLVSEVSSYFDEKANIAALQAENEWFHNLQSIVEKALSKYNTSIEEDFSGINLDDLSEEVRGLYEHMKLFEEKYLNDNLPYNEKELEIAKVLETENRQADNYCINVSVTNQFLRPQLPSLSTSKANLNTVSVDKDEATGSKNKDKQRKNLQENDKYNSRQQGIFKKSVHDSTLKQPLLHNQHQLKK